MHKAEGADPGAGTAPQPGEKSQISRSKGGRPRKVAASSGRGETGPNLTEVFCAPGLRRGQFGPQKGLSVPGAPWRLGLDQAGNVPHLLPGVFLNWGLSPIFLIYFLFLHWETVQSPLIRKENFPQTLLMNPEGQGAKYLPFL